MLRAKQPTINLKKRLSQTGDNLPNVIQYLQERYPERLEKVISSLANQVPRLEKG